MHAKLNSFGAPSLLLLVVLCYQNVGGSPADAAPPNDLVVEVCHGHAHSNVGHTLRRRTIDSSYGSSVSRCPVEAGSSHQESCPSLQNYADARSDKNFERVNYYCNQLSAAHLAGWRCLCTEAEQNSLWQAYCLL